MKIKFDKTDSYYQILIDRDDFYWRLKPPFPEREVKKLMNLIKERFPTMRMYRNHVIRFTFVDKADEAAFLLWSNEGIEI